MSGLRDLIEPAVIERTLRRIGAWDAAVTLAAIEEGSPRAMVYAEGIGRACATHAGGVAITIEAAIEAVRAAGLPVHPSRRSP